MEYNKPNQLSVERRHFIEPENYAVDFLEDDDQFEKSLLEDLKGNIQFIRQFLTCNLTFMTYSQSL